jgi:hypothetical protein
MRDIEYTNNPVNENLNSTQDEFLWGAEKIAPAIGRTQRQLYHLVATGRLKSVKRIGNRLVASRSALLRELGA